MSSQNQQSNVGNPVPVSDHNQIQTQTSASQAPPPPAHLEAASPQGPAHLALAPAHPTTQLLHTPSHIPAPFVQSHPHFAPSPQAMTPDNASDRTIRQGAIRVSTNANANDDASSREEILGAQVQYALSPSHMALSYPGMPVSYGSPMISTPVGLFASPVQALAAPSYPSYGGQGGFPSAYSPHYGPPSPTYGPSQGGSASASSSNYPPSQPDAMGMVMAHPHRAYALESRYTSLPASSGPVIEEHKKTLLRDWLPVAIGGGKKKESSSSSRRSAGSSSRPSAGSSGVASPAVHISTSSRASLLNSSFREAFILTEAFTYYFDHKFWFGAIRRVAPTASDEEVRHAAWEVVKVLTETIFLTHD